MTKLNRRNHSAAFKAKVALATVKGDALLADLSKRVDLRPNQIAQTKNQLIAAAANAFGGEGKVESVIDVKSLHAKISQLTLDNDFFRRCAIKTGLLSAKR